MLSKPRDEPDTEVVGAGVLHGLPGESIHCVTIEYNEFSVQVQSSLKDDHELQCPVEDENVISMNQALGWIIRWPATDMRLLETPVEEAAGAVGAALDSNDNNTSWCEEAQDPNEGNCQISSEEAEDEGGYKKVAQETCIHRQGRG